LGRFFIYKKKNYQLLLAMFAGNLTECRKGRTNVEIKKPITTGVVFIISTFLPFYVKKINISGFSCGYFSIIINCFHRVAKKVET